MKYTKVLITDFYVRSNYEGILLRLDQIQPDAQRLWGQMTVDQMLHHLNLAIGGGLGYFSVKSESNFLKETVIQFAVLNILRGLPINSKTPKALVSSEVFDFEKEKSQLKEILEKAFHTQNDADWGPHPYFGKMTRKAWGKLIMIHCNHHFQQFRN